jgi:hypothetical protein
MENEKSFDEFVHYLLKNIQSYDDYRHGLKRRPHVDFGKYEKEFKQLNELIETFDFVDVKPN